MKTLSRYEIGLLIALALPAATLLVVRTFGGRAADSLVGKLEIIAATTPIDSAQARSAQSDEEASAQTTAFRPYRDPVLAARTNAAAIYRLVQASQWDEAYEILGTLPRSEQQRLFIELLTFRPSKARDEILERVTWRLVADPSQATRLLSLVPDPTLEKTLARSWLGNLIASNNGNEASARWVVEQGSRYFDEKEARDELASLLQNWARVSDNPQAAMHFTDQMLLDGDTLSGLDRAVESACTWWSYRDLQGVTAWATALSGDDPRKNPALIGMLTGLTQQSPDKARAFLEEQLAAGNDAVLKMAEVVGGNSFGDPTMTEQWAASLPAAARDVVLRSMVRDWIMAADEEAGIVTDPPKAALWADTLPPDAARGNTWGSVAYWWSLYHTPAPAKEWLRSLPSGADREVTITTYDQAVAERAATWFSEHPGESLDSVQNDIINPAFSAAQVQTLLARWASIADPASANAWAAGHVVPMPKLQAATH